MPEKQFDDDDDKVIKSGRDISRFLRMQPGIDGTKSTCVLLEKSSI